jgi:hypothetical protein
MPLKVSALSCVEKCFHFLTGHLSSQTALLVGLYLIWTNSVQLFLRISSLAFGFGSWCLVYPQSIYSEFFLEQ